MKDPNTGELSGINYDQINAIAKALGVKIEWTVETSLDQIPSVLSTQKADMLCPTLWASSNRAWDLDFSTPLQYTPLYSMVRADDTRFDGNLSKLNDPNITIVFIDGDSPQAVANAKFPKAKQLALPNTSDGTHNLLSVMTGKADVTFVDRYILDEFSKNNPGKIRAIKDVSHVQIFGETLAVAKGETKLRDMLNVAIFEIQNNGQMDAILEKWNMDNEAFLKAGKPYQ